MRKQNLDFRRSETQYIMRRWLASESCSLVGVGSVGKSNLLQHLVDEDVHKHYGIESVRLKAIILDPFLLGPMPDTRDDQFRVWAAYELMMHRLYLAFYPFEEFSDDASFFYDAYQTLQDGTNPLFAYMGIRYFELGLQFLLRRGYRVVFMFDEFDAWLRLMPPAYFQSLRGLRDNYKSQLMYLTFTRKSVESLISDMKLDYQQIEPFYELFSDNILHIGPYSNQDANDMLTRLETRNQSKLSQHARLFLLSASGNHAGLLRAAFKSESLLANLPQQYDYLKALNALSNESHVRAESRVIWDSLDTDERNTLKSIVSKEQIRDADHHIIKALVSKGLVTTHSGDHSLQITPPIFADYIQRID